MGKWTIWIVVIMLGLASATITGHAADPMDKATHADETGQGPAAPDQNWQVGFTPSYSSGNFGTSATSTFFYAPISIRRLFRDGDVTLVIPFVTATTDGRTTLVGGNPTRVDDGSGGNSGPGGGSGGGGSGDDDNCSGSNSGPGGGKKTCGTTTRLPGQKVTTAGIGDIILKGRYYIVEEQDDVPLIAITGRMKIPTANADLGLGTGAFDYGFGVEVTKMFGNHWIGFLDGGYNIIGDPEGINFQNQHWYDVGAGYYWTKDLLTSVYFEEYRAIIRDFVNARDFFFAVNYTASSAWRVNGGVTLGVSNGAPDYTFSVGASYRF